jgi:hypothetical protein
MVDKLLGPGVQHGEHADGAAGVTAIMGQLDDGLRRCLHERGVAVALIGAQHIAQLRRHRDRDVEIRTRQQLGFARGEPALGLITMACRAAPVLAGVVRVDLGAAMVAAPAVPAEHFGPAGQDVGDGAAV